MKTIEWFVVVVAFRKNSSCVFHSRPEEMSAKKAFVLPVVALGKRASELPTNPGFMGGKINQMIFCVMFFNRTTNRLTTSQSCSSFN